MKLISSMLICIPYFAIAQVGIGTKTPNQSAMLEVSSTNKGILLPRMTKTETEAIVNPAAGLIVFCTDCCVQPTLYYYNGSTWIPTSTCDTPPAADPPMVSTDFSLVAGSDPHHLTASEMPYLFDGDTLPPAGISNMNLHTFHQNNPNPNTLELVSPDLLPIGTKISVYWYNNSTESDHLELSFSSDGGTTYTNAVSSPNSALSGVTYNFTTYTTMEFNAIRLKATLPPGSGEAAEPFLNEIRINDGDVTITFQN